MWPTVNAPEEKGDKASGSGLGSCQVLVDLAWESGPPRRQGLGLEKG